MTTTLQGPNNFADDGGAIALQFPDKLLADSVEIATIIRERTQKKVFILADTSYG
ncbi:349_t:CDS:2, partial [Entrophospora sp. SA101]